ncbi:hypothetical protein [Xenorhabdus griffiniae]|uniref:NERD domain-containing protein n=1 Tax=Xenorhabdus griffiniae TaxID=351672 RepID=A0ABY9XGH4_9GAMM|nr:hypothetical protein [Xenorhabdus griffiniae]MBD1229056.1 hypothetical protein [Xenorhabdus griffiniae]MBE8588804.1 hypothetical protein [Xenorhabdus griffiniae]WMV72042.1 hypothetical protein QL128_18315 [Xenorhabdus griffiniae]WNH01720.1 hypothetical protein QL112_018325 [Xenorhabdus griffiniae]
MVYYDAREITNLVKDAEKFVVFYRSWIDKVEIEPALSVLKISALYYHRFSEQSEEDYTHYFGRCIYQLLLRFPSHRDRILKTENDCRTIHLAYNNFFRRIRVMDKRYHSSTDKEHKLNAFLILSEISLSIMCSLLENIPSDRVESIFPVVLRMHGLPLSEDVTPQNIKSISMVFDQVCSYTGNIFRELRHVNSLNLEYHCSEQAVKNTGSWLKEWDDFDSLNRISDLFRFCNAEISHSDLNNISIEVDECCAYKAYEVARSRFTMRGTALYYEIQQLLEENPNFVEQLKQVVPEWINERDFFSIAYFSEMENMSLEDLYFEYGGVTIYAWIHAYEMLVALAKQEMDNRFQRLIPGNLQLKDWVIYHTRDEWIHFFAEGGLSWTTAALVTDYFTFDDKALDMNDCPLLPCSDGLCLMPSIVSMSSATRSLLSLFSAKNMSLDDKGKSHERQFIKRVRKARICAAQLSVRKNYDCDCAMVIDDHLFFIELKSNGHPVRFNRYYQTLVNINGDNAAVRTKSSWIKQVTRYADYYAAQLDLVRDALNLPSKWKPKGLHKMIITTSMFGDIYHQDGCYVVDKTAFYSFIDRLASTTTELKNGMRTLIKPESDHFYHGEITIDKMLGFLEVLPSITAKRRRVQQLTYNVQCGKLNFTYPFFDIWPALETVLKEDGSETVAML